ncbi:MAG: hypothetical protein RLZZ44_483 [Bacteroidota bacterium]
MNIKVAITLTIQEARKELVDYYHKFILGDSKNLYELIENGELCIPNFKIISDDGIVEQFGELNLGEKIAKENNASQVLIKTGEYNRSVVFDIENVEPSARWLVQI